MASGIQDPLHDFLVGATTIGGEIHKGFDDMGDAIVDTATGAVETVQGGVNAAGEFVSNGVDAIGDGINTVGEQIGDGIDAVGQAMADWGQGVADYWTGTMADAQEGYERGRSGEATPIGDTLDSVNDAIIDVRAAQAAGREAQSEWLDAHRNAGANEDTIANTTASAATQAQTVVDGLEM